MRHTILFVIVLAAALPGPRAARAETVDDVAGARGAAKAFMLALLNGDEARASKVAHLTKRDGPFLKAMALNLGGDAKLAAVIEKRFGPSEAANTRARVADLIDLSPVEVHGTIAELGQPTGETLPMRKVAGAWKVDVAELAARRDGADVLPLAEARAKEIRSVVARVEAGAYATASDARMARNETLAVARRAVEEQTQAASVDAR